jgi:asparagine synthase (glutamine-hydrolysing)
MSGIAGRFNLDSRAAEPYWLQPPAVSRPDVAVAFDGRLDDREALLAACRAPAAQSSDPPPDAACVAAAYEHAADRFASLLNGDFALALFDGRRRQLFLARDVMGCRRLHYTRRGDTLLFASEIKTLLSEPGVAAVPDEDAIAELVLDKWVDGHHTGFKGIYSVPPGHMVVAGTGTIEIRRHWAFDPARRIRHGSFDQYLDEFRSLFAQAVRRRMRSSRPVAVSVSGGVDSSSLLCQAAALHAKDPGLAAVRGIALTFPPGTPANEDGFLDDLDRWLGDPIIRLPVSELGLFDEATAAITFSEMPALVWDAHSRLFAQARLEGCGVILDGYFGDQMLFGRAYLVDLARRGRWPTIRRDLREFDAWMRDSGDGFYRGELRGRLLRALVPRAAFQAIKKRATGRRAARYASLYRQSFVDRVLDRQLGRFPPLPFASRHTEEFHRHLTAGHYLFYLQRQSAAARMHGLDLACPFRDRDLAAFLMAIPGEIVNAHGVPKGLLREALAGTLPPSIRARRWKADFTPLGNQAVVRDYASVTRLLTRNALVVQAGFVDGDRIEPSVAAFKRAVEEDETAEAGWQVGDLVALEIWLRQFFGAVGEPSALVAGRHEQTLF